MIPLLNNVQGCGALAFNPEWHNPPTPPFTTARGHSAAADMKTGQPKKRSTRNVPLSLSLYAQQERIINRTSELQNNHNRTQEAPAALFVPALESAPTGSGGGGCHASLMIRIGFWCILQYDCNAIVSEPSGFKKSENNHSAPNLSNEEFAG